MLEGMSEQVSTFAADVDRAFWVSTIISFVMFVLVIGAMLFFVWKYHHSRVKPEDIENIEDNLGLEIAWTVIPTMLLMIIFYYGYEALKSVRTMPKTGFDVEVLAKRWSWSFIYPNGKRTSELYVPLNENIRLKMTVPANDVLHSFYVPAFRIKEDVIPAQITRLWFNANKTGRFNIECAEYCGTRHSFMLSFVDVMNKEDFDNWYKSEKLTPYDKEEEKSEGEVLFETLGCISCHSMDGSIIVGPSLKDIYSKEVSILKNGKTLKKIRDEKYLKESILTPNKEIVEGFFPDIMPPFKQQIDQKQLQALVLFIKGEKSGPSKGQILFETRGCTGCHSLDASVIVGPSLKGIFMRETNIQGLGKVISDEAYIRNSILNPNRQIVEGFPAGVMIPYKDILSEDDVKEIILYLKEIK